MKKFIFTLVLVTQMTCEAVFEEFTKIIYRCENDEVVCYTITGGHKGLQCEFKKNLEGNTIQANQVADIKIQERG